MNENERAELEAENDGYSNDLQRALAVSRLNANLRNDRRKLPELLANGLTVYMLCETVYCRSTDAVLGETCKIVGCDQDHKVAHKALSRW